MNRIMRRCKEMGPGMMGGEHGFTLIEMLIVMVIVAILLGGVIYAIGGFGGGAQSTSYDLHKSTIENACMDYWVAHDYEYPTLNTTATVKDADGDDHTCSVIDLCLLDELGYFDTFPTSACNLDDPTDNCDGTDPSCTDCSDNTGHYVWYWDDNEEKVRSLCYGDACTQNAEDDGDAYDGYQDVFP